MIVSPKFREREIGYEGSLYNLKRMNRNGEDKIVWFHAASMGEFEQAKPVIEKLKQNSSNIKIIVSFFSPSGYRNQKNYKYADAVSYMPIDTIRKSKEFIDLINPDIAIFVRYDIWHNHLKYLNKNEIPIYLINATKPSSYLLRDFPMLNKFAGLNYNYFSEIYPVSTDDLKFFQNIECKVNLTPLPDTRFDRIMEKVNLFKDNNEYKKVMNRFVLVAGSTWRKDEEIIIESYNNLPDKAKSEISIILVPHEPDEEVIMNIGKKLLDSRKLSELDSNNLFDSYKHIVVDSVGKLLSLYSIADIAYIGGGFNSGVHSVAEPAGYGIPLAVGRKYKNSPDAVNLNNIKALQSIDSSEELIKWIMNYYENNEYRSEVGLKARNYILKGIGSSTEVTRKIISELELKQENHES